MKLAEQHNLAVYVTNQVMANPAQMFGDPTVAIGGNIVGHASTYRMYIRRGKQGSRVAKLIDSPNLPDNETIYLCYRSWSKRRRENKIPLRGFEPRLQPPQGCVLSVELQEHKANLTVHPYQPLS